MSGLESKQLHVWVFETEAWVADDYIVVVAPDYETAERLAFDDKLDASNLQKLIGAIKVEEGRTMSFG